MNDINNNEALNSDNLGTRARTAIGWKFLSQGLTTGLQMVTSIVLARLLMPKDFGILGMATMAIGLASIFRDLGLGQALVQRKHLEKVHLASAYWGTMVMGALLTGLTILLAPHVGSFFKEPRMIPVLQVISFTFVIGPFTTIPNAMLQRNLDFQRPFYAGVASSVTYAAVGLTMALQGYSYWSLVWSLLASTIVSTVAICIITRHLPPAVPCFRGIRELCSFGIGTTGAGMFNYIAQQADYFVVGRWLDSTALGLYTRAFTLVHTPLSQVSSILVPVLFPAFTQMQDDVPRVRAILARTISTIAVIVWPILTLAAVTAPELVVCLFGAQWTGAVVPVQIMAIAGMLRAVNNPFGVIAKAFGRVYDEMWRQALYAAMLFGAALIGQKWGIVGVSWGALFSTVVFFGMIANLAHICCNIGVLDIVRALMEPALLSLTIVALTSSVRLSLLQWGIPQMSVLLLTLLSGLLVIGLAIVCFPNSRMRTSFDALRTVWSKPDTAKNE